MMKAVIEDDGKGHDDAPDKVHDVIIGFSGNKAENIGTEPITGIEKDEIRAGGQTASMTWSRFDGNSLEAWQQRAEAEPNNASGQQEDEGCIRLAQPKHADDEQYDTGIDKHMLAFAVEQSAGKGSGYKYHCGEYHEEIAGYLLQADRFGIDGDEGGDGPVRKCQYTACQRNRNSLGLDKSFPVPGRAGAGVSGSLVIAPHRRARRESTKQAMNRTWKLAFVISVNPRNGPMTIARLMNRLK